MSINLSDPLLRTLIHSESLHSFHHFVFRFFINFLLRKDKRGLGFIVSPNVDLSLVSFTTCDLERAGKCADSTGERGEGKVLKVEGSRVMSTYIKSSHPTLSFFLRFFLIILDELISSCANFSSNDAFRFQISCLALMIYFTLEATEGSHKRMICIPIVT
ncbi:hypothetical protein IE53DRAFT_209031 [Violaceomyces palustris]|uniref:Uncharacterized protein n=1 Tax=Violaceomyces palustris TaxID=1673888 RepID=A0ACD0NR10_9BASI|nr:hypothetical protein IE53DRAFT_209031 [Violaceomyces palustris]